MSDFFLTRGLGTSAAVALLLLGGAALAVVVRRRCRRPTGTTPSPLRLDAPLFYWSRRDPFRLRDLLAAGVVIFGRAGAGKSSGSGRTLARAIVRHPRSAGAILAAKPEERAEWEGLFAEAGRPDDLLVVSPAHDLKCDFLDYELRHGGSTRDAVACLRTVGETLRSGDRQGGDDGEFWRTQQERLLYHAVCVVKLATGKVSAPELQKFIDVAALSPEQLRSPEFRDGLHSRTLEAAFAAPKSPDDAEDYERAAAFWLAEWPAMAERTRSSILAGVMGLLFVFNSGVVRRLASSGTNVSPDDILAGKWVLVDMSPTEWGDAGAFVQAGWKYLVQKAVLRRAARPTDPFVVVWCDEAQQTLNSFDAQFAAQSRSHLGCTVALTQSLHGVYAALRGESGKQQALAFLATMGTRIFHALGSAEDARHASDLIGRRVTLRFGGSLAPAKSMHDALFGEDGVTASFSEQVEAIVEPRVFMSGLRTGAPANRGLVDAVVVRSGEPFSSGENFLLTTFQQ